MVEPEDQRAREEFGRKLDGLHKQRERELGRKIHDTEVARHLTWYLEREREYTSAYVGKARRGEAPPPRVDVAAGFADFYQVHPAYFLSGRHDSADAAASGDKSDDSQLAALQIAYRLSNMSDHARRVVTDVIESFEQREKSPLPDRDTE